MKLYDAKAFKKLPLAKRHAIQEAAWKKWSDAEWERVNKVHLLDPDEKDMEDDWAWSRNQVVMEYCG